MIRSELVPAMSGKAWWVPHRSVVKIVDVEGSQTALTTADEKRTTTIGFEVADGVDRDSSVSRSPGAPGPR